MIEPIKVRLGPRSYTVLIKRGLLNELPLAIRKSTKAAKIAILSNPKVYDLFGEHLIRGLERLEKRAIKILIPDGEGNKNEKSLFFILKKMAAFGLKRDDALITLGGGVTGDLGGLAASVYMRGIDLIHCPTTLLAQVDASIGGKTGIDFFGTKNLLGSFHQPRIVLVDPSVLYSLSERTYRTGLAEIIKYGIIQAPWIFSEFENSLPRILKRDPVVLDQLIEASCRIKAGIVSSDERESGERAWLNYGHTLGHALESYFDYHYLTHGEAIAYGMWFAAKLSEKLGYCSTGLVERHFSLFKKVGLLRPMPKFKPRLVLEKLSLDKKARRTGIQFILTRKIGLVTIRKNLPAKLLSATLVQFQDDIQRYS